MQANSDEKAVLSQGFVEVVNDLGRGEVILACEHASAFIPPAFQDLGLQGEALTSHIAWDIGAFSVARILSGRLDAPLVAPAVSRLVYDCNRAMGEADAIPEKSEYYDIPGNRGLGEAERQERHDACYLPFRRALVNALDRVEREGRSVAFVTIHSFTPVYKGVSRELDIGLLHDRDDRLAGSLLSLMSADGIYRVACNEPYGPEDGVTHTLREHALPRNLPNVMIEIRNDLLLDEASRQLMAERLAGYLKDALKVLQAGKGGA